MKISTVLSTHSNMQRAEFEHASPPLLYGEVRAYFTNQPDLERIQFSDIHNEFADWVMHGSRQNNCQHLKVNGMCYRLKTMKVVYRQPYYSFPTFEMKGGGSTWYANVPFPLKTGMTPLFTSSDGPKKRTLYLASIWERCTKSQYSNMYYMWSYAYTVYENAETGIKQFDALGRHYTFWLTLGVIYYDGTSCSNNFVGRGTHKVELYFDINNQPAIRFTADSNYYDQGRPQPRSCNWFNVEPEYPILEEILKFDPIGRFKISFDWSDALARGLNQVNFFDSNGIAFAKDTAALPSALRSDLESLKSFSKVSRSGKVRIAASIFLSIHYGYKLMISDAEELLTELLHYERTTVRHIGQSVSGDTSLHSVGDFELLEASGHLNVYYHPFSKLITEIGAFLEAFDLIPDISNIWDMIPFSFVVDWFTNLGDLASGIDDFFTLTQECEVEGTIMSQKIRYLYHPQDYFGDVTISSYTRSCRAGWYPIPKYSFQLKNPVTDLYHWMESTALVVSKIP